VPLTGNVLESKIELLHEHLGRSAQRTEFDRVSLAGLARFRRGFAPRKAKIH
jgi:hypothetical protein